MVNWETTLLIVIGAVIAVPCAIFWGVMLAHAAKSKQWGWFAIMVVLAPAALFYRLDGDQHRSYRVLRPKLPQRTVSRTPIPHH
ncbi:MAG: hypothetical protein L0Z55_05720 [Planctomycetes bacterium]|nr:hypothetical protein [Planctomycetota bacterium]